MAQFVFVYDSARHRLRRDAEIGARAAGVGTRAIRAASRIRRCATSSARPSSSRRSTTSLPDPSVLQRRPPTRTSPTVTAPLWAWYDQLRPSLWREGREFPETGPAQRQLMNDGAIDLLMSFDPAEAAVVDRQPAAARQRARLSSWPRARSATPASSRSLQRRAQGSGAWWSPTSCSSPRPRRAPRTRAWGGNLTVLDLAKLSAAQARRFRARRPTCRDADQRVARRAPARAAPELDDPHHRRVGEAIFALTLDRVAPDGAAAGAYAGRQGRGRRRRGSRSRSSCCRSPPGWSARCCRRSATCPRSAATSSPSRPWRALAQPAGRRRPRCG